MIIPLHGRLQRNISFIDVGKIGKIWFPYGISSMEQTLPQFSKKQANCAIVGIFLLKFAINIYTTKSYSENARGFAKNAMKYPG